MTPKNQPNCPRCGAIMTEIHSGEDGKIRYECPRCPSNGKGDFREKEQHRSGMHRPSEDPRTRFRRLLQANEESKTLDLPDVLIEDLPEEARQLLRRGEDKLRPSIGPQLSDDLAQALRDQGYLVDEDVRGLRISGHLSTMGTNSGKLSSYDILRMAADLEGGLQKPEERRRCPNCDAVLPKGHTSCDWCGTSVQ
jgi:ribosomal protein S27AE